MDAYFSADVETDGPIPGSFSMLSFALVYAGSYDGDVFSHPDDYEQSFYRELSPISRLYQEEALQVTSINRRNLIVEGASPVDAMDEAAKWIKIVAGERTPVLIAYPLSFDWLWIYWYFVQFSTYGSPFDYSKCYDLKTAVAVKSGRPISEAGRSKLPSFLRGQHAHSHHALDDAVEQAQIFAKVFEWRRTVGADC